MIQPAAAAPAPPPMVIAYRKSLYRRFIHLLLI
jgi:hypothetical protein